ncbi:unnamed protein product [Linum trigynum]|uniref:Uncharacterized protein n=1 Tax=Linum trigynum TaxID=586398 RepID=A0AAV2E3V6_9ROSI
MTKSLAAAALSDRVKFVDLPPNDAAVDPTVKDVVKFFMDSYKSHARDAIAKLVQASPLVYGLSWTCSAPHSSTSPTNSASRATSSTPLAPDVSILPSISRISGTTTTLPSPISTTQKPIGQSKASITRFRTKSSLVLFSTHSSATDFLISSNDTETQREF